MVSSVNQVVWICILFKYFLLIPPQWFTHPPSFAWLLSGLMEDWNMRCSYDTLHSPTRSAPISPAACHSPWPRGSGCPPTCVRSAVSVIRVPSCPQMPVCGADSQLEHSCLEDVFYSVSVMSMFSSVWSKPELAHPKQKHKGSLLVLHNILLGFFQKNHFLISI